MTLRMQIKVQGDAAELEALVLALRGAGATVTFGSHTLCSDCGGPKKTDRGPRCSSCARKAVVARKRQRERLAAQMARLASYRSTSPRRHETKEDER